MTAPEFATLTTDDLVTGEAVALDLPPASLGLRIASGLIDVITTVVLLFVVILVASIATLGTDAALAAVAFIGSIVIVFVVFPTTMETLTRGRSLGKLALGLRTVRDDAGPISFQHSFIRALVGFVEIYAFCGAPAFFSALLSSRGKRLGDYAAGTYVVRERVKLQLSSSGRDAAAPRRLGAARRHHLAAHRPGAGGPSVPRPAARRSTRPPGSRSAPGSPTRCSSTSPPSRRRGPHPRTSSPP